MDVYLEQPHPERDLGGLCECFISTSKDARPVAQPHVHQYFELLYCLSGCYELKAEQHTHRLAPGDAALIHPMEPHQTRSLEKGENRYLVLKFTPEALYSSGQPAYELKYILPYLRFSAQHCYVYTARQLENSRMGDLLGCILDECNQARYGYEMAVRAYVLQVLLWFLRAWNDTRDAKAIDERTLLRLQRAVEIIDDHLDEPLKAQDMAGHLGMGLSSFSRFFSAAAGMSFPAYVRSRRLSRAAALLSDPGRSVTDIALETGFTTASYLILCFRRQYGVTPNQYRRMYGQPE